MNSTAANLTHKGFTICHVEKGSPAWRKKVVPGDSLLMIDGCFIKDIIDYRYLMAGETLNLVIKTKNGIIRRCNIRKQYDEDPGLGFNHLTLEPPIRCRNKCVFCFVDQLPPGLRNALYFKDDDYRLSFLYGNYISLTALRNKDLKRIIKQHLSPLYISIHATDPAVRACMLRNQQGANILKQLSILAAHEIEFHGQVVLCPGINDGHVLEKTISDLAKLYPSMRSLAVVPVGLTDYRDSLSILNPVTTQTAGKVLSLIEHQQKSFLKSFGTRFVFPADEFFLKAKKTIPPDTYYEDYLQLENGVGLWRLFAEEIHAWNSDLNKYSWQRVSRKIKLYLVTGLAAAGLMEEVANILNQFPHVSATLVVAKNYFFGQNINVAGLLTGQDILKAMQGKEGDYLLIPRVMLKENTDSFLDGINLDILSRELSMQTIPINSLREVNPLLYEGRWQK